MIKKEGRKSPNKNNLTVREDAGAFKCRFCQILHIGKKTEAKNENKRRRNIWKTYTQCPKKAGADPNTTGGDCAGGISLYPDDMPDLDEELAEITDDKLMYKILNVKQFSVAKK